MLCLAFFRVVFGLVFSLATLWSQPAPPTEPAPAETSVQSSFQSGLAAFRKGDFINAKASFEKALQVDPLSVASIYNLGLVESRLGNRGRAMAMWRKALSISPSYHQAAVALRQAEAQLPRVSNRDEGVWGWFRRQLLTRISLFQTAALGIFSIALFVFSVLRYLGLRRIARLDERPIPSVTPVTHITAGLMVLTLSLLATKAYDRSITRATIVGEKVSALTIPDTAGTALLDLFEGIEVVVRQSQGDWLQVTVPGGLTGWIPRDMAIISSQPGGKL